MLEDSYQPTPIATWNPARGVWETSEANLFCEHLEQYAEVWRTSGMTLGGKLFALPTLAHPTTEPESLSSPTLLRSPKASEGQGGALGEAEAIRRGNTVGVRDQVLDLVAEQGLKVSRTERNLLPTTTATDSKGSRSLTVLDPEGNKRPKAGATLNDLVFDGSLLPTPNTMDSLAPRSDEARERQLRRGKSDGPMRSTTGNLREDILFLPTPAARDYKDGTGDRVRDGVVQTDSVSRAVLSSGEVELLPTTRTSMANGPTKKEIDAGNPKSRIETEVMLGDVSWGKFEPAIRRWESVLGRKAPNPTIADGKEGAHRLSSLFTEWMMGLPAGWITDAGVGRVAELKMAGNGVVPQQASFALRRLLGVPSGANVVNESAMMPTPTASDERDGKHLRSIAVTHLKKGKNSGINLNHLVENIGVDWEEGDRFDIVDGKAKRIGK